MLHKITFRGFNRARQSKRWRIALIGMALLLICLIADYYLYPQWSRVGGQSLNRAENGLWLHYSWYFGQRSEADLKQLAQRLKQNQIRYAYFWVRYSKADGTLRYHYPQAARHLVTTLHREAPGVKIIAWVYAGNQRGAGGVVLGNGAVRRNMVKETQWLVNTCGFDGIQWDYEICDNGDPQLLTLLRETRAALPNTKLLSVATPMWLPASLGHWGWSDAYFAQVGATCDQMTVMCYDSALYLPRSYVWLVRQQAIHVTQAGVRNNPRCRILLGVPTYRRGGLSHHYHAENLYLALKGVREGMTNSYANKSSLAGVAPFADYTTTPTDWKTYRHLWLQQND